MSTVISRLETNSRKFTYISIATSISEVGRLVIGLKDIEGVDDIQIHGVPGINLLTVTLSESVDDFLRTLDSQLVEARQYYRKFNLDEFESAPALPESESDPDDIFPHPTPPERDSSEDSDFDQTIELPIEGADFDEEDHSDDSDFDGNSFSG